VNVKNNCIDVSEIQGVLYDIIKEDTHCGVVNKSFDNTTELKDELHALSMPDFFAILKTKVDAYYAGS
jgi:CRISPR-associated protein Cst2